jgi:hypothetical protein
MYVWVFCPFTVGFHIAVEWIYCKNVTKGNAFAMCFMIQECEVPKLCSFYFLLQQDVFMVIMFLRSMEEGERSFGCGW